MVGDDLLSERLLRVVDEGRRTATYKLALLLALIDAAALAPGENSVATRDLAALVLEVYFPQTRVYVANDGIERELRQITMKGSPPLRAVLRLRLHGDAAGCRNVAEVRRRLPDEYARALDVVEETFVRYPIPLLQVVGKRVIPFLLQAPVENVFGQLADSCAPRPVTVRILGVCGPDGEERAPASFCFPPVAQILEQSVVTTRYEVLFEFSGY